MPKHLYYAYTKYGKLEWRPDRGPNKKKRPNLEEMHTHTHYDRCVHADGRSLFERSVKGTAGWVSGNDGGGCCHGSQISGWSTHVCAAFYDEPCYYVIMPSPAYLVRSSHAIISQVGRYFMSRRRPNEPPEHIISNRVHMVRSRENITCIS